MLSVHGLIRGERIEMGCDSDTGGQVRYALELAKTLSAFDEVAQVDLFTRLVRDKRVSSDYSLPVEQLTPKCRLVRIPCGGGRYMRKEKLWPFLDDFADGVISFTRREGRRPDLVHGHYADAGYVGKEVASAFGVPFVFTGHSLGRDKLAYLLEEGWTLEQANRTYRIDHRIAMEETCLSIADLVVTSTHHEREDQYAKYDHGGVPRFEVIPPGITLDRFFPHYDYELAPDQVDETYKQARVRMVEELDRFHFHQEKPLILALCRPDKRKNIGALIEAYGENKELQAIANLAVFAGIRKNIAEMEEDEQQVLTDILLLMDRYDLYGLMALPKRHESETDVPELYRLAASKRGVFVNTAFVEPFGLTFIESSAVGLPFVGTQNGGPQDIVANCESGIIVDVSDRDALTTAIKKLLTDRRFWQQCSANGINKVREYYTWETHCRHYIDTVREIIGQPSKSPFAVMADKSAPAERMAAVDSLLITDIDNTLLGDDSALDELKAIVAEHRHHMGFGVASGRHIDAIREVLDEYALGPLDLMIASVGTEIYYGDEHTPDKGWASHLRSKWKPERILETCAQLEFLQLQKDQKTQREFKISYDLDDTVDPDEALAQVHAALAHARVAYTLIFSHGCYLDILAHRASKGKAIRHISTKWNVPLDKIATSGDSGNDRDMLTGQTAGIVVGNHDKELASLRESTARIYFAGANHAAGIIEGLRHYAFIPGEATP